ncbi:hypothetical protein AB0F17_57105 [Nonomuraea sp. NPDC026600]|uniref:hypothetical protein n=1 Tax=Nonomuraea sp. NPDC026600 TaxID=3155363 RepID=UPI0033DB9D05
MTGELLERMAEASHAPRIHEKINHKIAARHDEALAELRALLDKRGMRTCIVEWLKLTLASADCAASSSSTLERYAPELVVFAPQGWRVAIVRISIRSGAYMVDVAQVGQDNALLPDKRYIEPEGQPAKAAARIPGYLLEMP